jgi:hypothetical protein
MHHVWIPEKCPFVCDHLHFAIVNVKSVDFKFVIFGEQVEQDLPYFA